MISEPICLRVKGPFACFTMPEFHVERVSYPVITPSAARGILEAILMKPVEKPDTAKRHNKAGFHWQILRLGVIRKGFLVALLRNELGYESHPAYGNTRGFDIMDKRAQRHSLILKDVDYLIEACIEVEATSALAASATGNPGGKPFRCLPSITRCSCAARAPANASTNRSSAAGSSRLPSGNWWKSSIRNRATGGCPLKPLSRCEV